MYIVSEFVYVISEFGIDGHYGAKFHCTLCIMTMKATVRTHYVIPN